MISVKSGNHWKAYLIVFSLVLNSNSTPLGVANAADGINGDGNNGAQYKNEQKRAWTLDNLIYYNKTLGQHNLGMTLMQSASAYHYEMGDMRATNVASSDELWYNIGSAGTLNSFGTGLTRDSNGILYDSSKLWL